ncbi:tetratricopeptide repeat protein [Ochrobactrum chromiisoli]|uniref:Tetratricopeptide repeat protein n=1 Tax=Ochrobactrum chromiisoli TaxID=2993941 RepID=A0ABT3QS53_9HYPH|nr:tetratricopeptide repeat protein [Ochrobactrum chromiisoli]MCX2698457.1 tetratricopeptide repeat protein [Ochrobactrum chromiisoli]
MRHHSTSALIVTCMALAACTTASENAQNHGPKGDEARLIALAQDIDQRGDKATAASLYERAANVSSDTVGAHNRLGDAQLKSGQPESAAKSFRTALAKDPNNGRALLGLGTAQLQSSEVESAARTLAVAAPIVKSSTAYNRLGTALILTGDGNGAEAAFAKARQHDPASLDTQSNLALAQALSGKTDAAVTTMRAATQSPRAEARHFRNLMLVLVLGGRDRDAAEVAVPDYPAAEKQAFLAEARKVRAIKSPSARARAIGLLASGAR